MEKSNRKLEYDKPDGKRLSNESNNYDLSPNGDHKLHSTPAEKENDNKTSIGYKNAILTGTIPDNDEGSHNILDDDEMGLTNTNLDKNAYINNPDLAERTKTGDRLSGKDNTIPKGDKCDDLK